MRSFWSVTPWLGDDKVERSESGSALRTASPCVWATGVAFKEERERERWRQEERALPGTDKCLTCQESDPTELRGLNGVEGLLSAGGLRRFYLNPFEFVGVADPSD